MYTLHPYSYHSEYDLYQLMAHHALRAVRPHAENGQEAFPHIQHAILATIHDDHGHLVGYVLHPHIPITHSIHQNTFLPGYSIEIGVLRLHGYEQPYYHPHHHHHEQPYYQPYRQEGVGEIVGQVMEDIFDGGHSHHHHEDDCW